MMMCEHETKNKTLVSAQASAHLDKEASMSWGLNPFALVEAAGRAAAVRLVHAFPSLFWKKPKTAVFAGSGNNGADAMVLVKSLIIWGKADDALLILNKMPDVSNPQTPHAQAFLCLAKMNIPFLVWDDTLPASFSIKELERFDIILDGIAGTGVKGAIKKQAAEMVRAINEIKNVKKISVDMPSGNFDGWNTAMPMPIVKADATLAIEPLKLCLYTPAARPFAGRIIPVEGIFPQPLITSYVEAELLDWRTENRNIPAIQPDAYKYSRGTIEIHAGSRDATGAARISARGAEASGAGLIRLLVDEDIYPIVASSSEGVMVAVSSSSAENRFPPDALLVGPGWGCNLKRLPALQKALEQRDVPLILDADAIRLAKDVNFNGKTILTPHAGELSAFLAVPKDEILANPVPILKKTAREKHAVILFKSHVMIIAAEDGRLGIVDGMTPVLGAGGSGDLLAGLCAGIAGRMQKSAAAGAAVFDAYTCACCAASLLIAAGKQAHGFATPFELADAAAQLAADAWLGRV
jgi:NAD(P)H-hydrate epimerase